MRGYMDRIINKVKLYVKDNNKAHDVEKNIKNALSKHNFELNENADIVISIGGDGTFIKMVHHSNFNNKFYASINAGSLGFLSSIDSDKIDSFVNDLNNNNFKIKEINLLKIKIYSNGVVKELKCLNELTVRNSDFSTFKADVLVNNKLLESYNGDGLVINTPAGSTAYSLALNGAVLDNDIKAFALTPIVPINNKVYKSLINSIILSENKEVTIIPSNNKNFCYVCDGKMEKLDKCDKISCKLEGSIKCIVLNDYDYFNTISSKIIDIKE